MKEYVLVATQSELIRMAVDDGSVSRGAGLGAHRPTDLSADPGVAGRVWCCTSRGGVFRSDDCGETWSPTGLEGERLMTVVASPAQPDLIWVGTEPSAVWFSEDAGASWNRTADLDTLPSAPGWAFPPRPETHHVRWIGCHPTRSGRLWVAVEAGALIRTADGGKSWSDKVPGGPYDTHELAVHPEAPEVLRVSAGDGYFESRDAGDSWTSPMQGLDVTYLRSVAIDPGDPDVVVVSGATGPRTAYVAGRSDGRLYLRRDQGAWHRVGSGWPDPPRTIAPLLSAGRRSGELWAADDRGVHHSHDGGSTWSQVGAYDTEPDHLRGLAIVVG